MSLCRLNYSKINRLRVNSITAILIQGWIWYWITHEGWYAIKMRWTVFKDNNSIYQFKKGDHWKDLQVILKSWGGCGWSQWQFLGINLISCISRYFHVILVNISDKWDVSLIFHFSIGLFVYRWHINLCRLFNARSILV